MKYTTKYIVNLLTGESFEFEVDEGRHRRFEREKIRISSFKLGDGPIPRYSVEQFTQMFECSLFPAYEEVLKIFFKNGYTEQLITQILVDFGLWPELADSIVKNSDYRKRVYGWFGGVTQDGDRASCTMRIAYYAVKDFLPKPTKAIDVPQLPA